SRAGHEEALHLVTTAVASSSSPVVALQALVSTFSAWHADNYAIARVVQHEFPHLSPEHRDEVLRMRKQIDAAVRSVLRAGVVSGAFTVDHEADTSLALLSIIVDVARWYAPSVRRTPAEIGRTNAALALRLVGHRG
ncbi:MAG TPA: TetR family transcriptional regulator, partial [Dermatophilaceae bacterium]|nr:TetR family transcriptional regulator [Dermatophilaceae bacterium]